MTEDRQTSDSPDSPELDGVFRLAEPGPPAQPPIERWAQFDDALMKDVAQPKGKRRPWRQRWQTLCDRFTASDSLLKKWLWAIVAIVFMLAFGLAIYLLY